MSTAVTLSDGVTRFVDFAKTVSGGWRFTWGKNEFVAWRDPAGFSHRDWVLYFVEKEPAGGIPKYFKDRVIDDNLSDRAACVESAINWSRFH